MGDSLKKANEFIEKNLNKGGRRGLWISLMIAAIVLIMITLFDSAIFRLNVPDKATTEEFISSLKAGDVDTVYYNSSKEMMRYTLFNDETRNMTSDEREK